MSEQRGKVRTETIKDLFTRFCKKAYYNDPSNMSDNFYLDKCIDLWRLDYFCEVMDVEDTICDSYPSRIVIPIYELGAGGEILEESSPVDFNVKSYPTFASVVSSCSSGDSNSPPLKKLDLPDFLKEMKDHLRKAAMARCRNRAPVPAILCKKKYVCRSGTLSVTVDVVRKNIIDQAVAAAATVMDKEEQPRYYDLSMARDIDINLLKIMNISVIMDLMVENKKTKYWLPVSSSEKIDKNDRYSDFKISVLPYPGCEFYKKFFDNGLRSNGLYHDWTDPMNNAELSVGSKNKDDPIPAKVTSDWANYKNWDIQQMSKHYLKLALMYLMDEESKESGLLVHCISGWDRTPLMTSLIRLSLWADGLAHSSLDPKQMLFFTLAYDWYLFGHQLPDRLRNGEFILYFCFEFLEEIVDDSYSMNERYERSKSKYLTMKERYSNLAQEELLSLSSTNSSTSDLCLESMQVYLPLNPKDEDICWPFNPDKENDYTFDGMADMDVNGKKSPEVTPKQRFSMRTPLMEQNKPTTPSRRVRRVSGEDPSSGDKRACNACKGSFVRESSGRKSKKSSGEPSVRFNHCQESVECEESDPDFVSTSSVSKPVAVPGATRARHESSSSTVSESWSMVSPSSLPSPHDHRFFRMNLEDSTTTIREEATPSSSIESSQSIIVFNRHLRLMEVRRLFFEIFRDVYDPTENGPSNAPEVVTDAFHKILSTEQ